ncbi:MAG: alcohol dehydrogenase catalytic domain-containing protein, partial [Verrucomicrobiales bacterium]
MSQNAVVNFSPDPGSVEIREIEYPEPDNDDVIIKVEAVGVCGSDIHQWHSTHSWPVNYPIVLGHEFGGRITETGKNVEGWKI